MKSPANTRADTTIAMERGAFVVAGAGGWDDVAGLVVTTVAAGKGVVAGAAIAWFTWMTKSDTGCNPTIPALPGQDVAAAWPRENRIVTLELSFRPL